MKGIVKGIICIGLLLGLFSGGAFAGKYLLDVNGRIDQKDKEERTYVAGPNGIGHALTTYTDEYKLKAKAGDHLLVTAATKKFDPMLTIIQPDGTRLSYYDIEQTVAGAKAEFTVAPGKDKLMISISRVVETSKSSGNFGSYHLRVEKIKK